MSRVIGAVTLALGFIGAGVQPGWGAACTQEIAAARGGSVYVVVEMPARLIRIKARGVVLRDFPLAELTWLGPPLDKPFLSVMTEKTPRREPLEIRPATSPIGGEPARADSEGRLDVSQMPRRYRLDLSDGVSLSVQSHRTHSILSTAYDEAAGVVRLWASRIAGWIGRSAGTPRRHLWIELRADDAQALYWALTPRTPILMVPSPC